MIYSENEYQNKQSWLLIKAAFVYLVTCSWKWDIKGIEWIWKGLLEKCTGKEEIRPGITGGNESWFIGWLVKKICNKADWSYTERRNIEGIYERRVN